MANISQQLAFIMSAVYGEEVRGSIHDAIDIINKVTEVQIDAGTDISAGDPAAEKYRFGKSIYINTTTNQILRCDGVVWTAVGNIKGDTGVSVESITKTGTEGLVDTYTILYSDGNTSTFDVTNGRIGADGEDGEDGNGIVSVVKTGEDGLTDVYTMTFTDGTEFVYRIGNGNRWYRGTVISGGSSTPTIFPTSGITLAHANDLYLNSSEGKIYACITGGAANIATWSYQMTLTGGGGGGTSDYEDLDNKPLINGIELKGSMTSTNLGIVWWGTHEDYEDDMALELIPDGTVVIFTDDFVDPANPSWNDISSKPFQSLFTDHFTVPTSGTDANKLKLADSLTQKLEQFDSNNKLKESALQDGTKAKLVDSVNPTLAGTETAVEGLEIGGTKYKVGGGHEMVSDIDDVLDADVSDNFVVNAATVAEFSNRYTDTVEFNITTATNVFEVTSPIFLASAGADDATFEFFFEPVPLSAGSDECQVITLSKAVIDTTLGKVTLTLGAKATVATTGYIDVTHYRQKEVTV